ncbi:hypothetical protein [Pseudomonas sp. EGD-AK9]|jgi:hypothetical protein|uniref:hypothetical protein n=1 Tax=Pseudomonas sp. EGD-AK9 TaxID=1386078 RepID=UPI0012E30E81|nr:hypothetical protein [Pseudomonas sp. EGD-AK9]
MTEQTYERLALAKEQLDVALSLLLEHQSYASAITLAGAAEEIFGRALTLRGETSAVDSSYATMSDFNNRLFGEELNKKSYVEQENYARNALKHLQEDKGPTITIDLEDAACWMLVRALKNAQTLGIEVELEREFNNWFYKNIVGV